jgi:multiple sugar transport system permease protein
MFPGVALITPLFELFQNIGWFGTYQALVIPDISFALPLTIYVLTAFFRDMPWELEEAAKIDGASPGQAFRKIILPLAAPGLFTTAILAFIAAWNEYVIALTLINTTENQPLTLGVTSFIGLNKTEWQFLFASCLIAIVPVVILFGLIEKYLISGLTAGSIK